MHYRLLGQTGLQVSTLGFGASPLGGVFGEIEESEGIRAVHIAADLGINFFDVSPFYGLTKAEEVLGKALQTLPRESFLLATKVGRYGQAEFDFSAARVTRSVEESLKRLQVETIDLIQCHDIEFGSLDQVVEETLPTLQRLRTQGKVRFSGITGLPLKIFPTVLDRAEADTILSYCHYTLCDTSLEILLPYLEAKRVGIINAAPLAMGLLTEEGPPSWHPAPPEMRAACAQAATTCRRQGTDIARLALQFAVAKPQIATTLVGMASEAQVRQNVACIAEPPETPLLTEVQAILAPIRNQTWPSGRPENNG
jgi:L-galactose dehydrogenase